MVICQSYSNWKHYISSDNPHLLDIYGSNCISSRNKYILECLECFISHFYDCKENIFIFRSPARINLRGMHIDTHGGACNSMAINKEVIIIGTKIKTKIITIHNPLYNDIIIPIHHLDNININNIKGWERYIYACFIVIRNIYPNLISNGFNISIQSDIPQGSGLSSSHALIIGILSCIKYCNIQDDKYHIDKIKYIRMAKQVEYIVGTTTGLSDQGAILYAQKNRIIHGNFYEYDSNDDIINSIQFLKFPKDIRVFIINSHTPRCLSGISKIDYFIPRFCNSISLSILQHINKQKDKQIDRISNVPIIYKTKKILQLLNDIPHEITLEQLKYNYPNISKKISTILHSNDYINDNTILPLRGPILYSISECKRAILFKEILKDIQKTNDNEQNYKKLGQLMNIGHKGDCISCNFIINNEQLELWKKQNTPIHCIPGSFKASTKILDDIQQYFINQGAYGASLTGAGLGGCVIALFPKNISKMKLYEELKHQKFVINHIKNHNIKDILFEVYPISGACFI